MKKNHPLPRRIAGLLVSLLIILQLGTAAAQPPEGRVLRVAFPELEGISETDAYGNHTGLLVDYLEEISKYTGWRYEYIPADGNDVVPNFLKGQYDLMGGTFYAPGFEQYFAYPNYNTGRSRAVLFCRKDDRSLRNYDLTTLNNKTIGVYEKATEKIRYLQEFLSSNDLTCQLRYYTYADMGSDGTLYQYLRNGDVDMILGNDLEVGGEFRLVTSFQAQPYYIVTTLGNTELLDGLNMALEHILESTPNFYDMVYNTYFPDIKVMGIQLNEEELAYVANQKTLTVAVPKNLHPIYFQETDTDHHSGMLPDLLEEISTFTGLSFTIVYPDTYEESLQMVRDGEADILGAYLGLEAEAFADGLALSQPYIDLSNIVIKHKSVSYPSPDLTCGILSGRTLPFGFEAAEVFYYDTVKELVAAANAGDVDYIFGVSASLEHEMQNYRYQNITPVRQASSSTQVAFAIAQPVSPVLLTTLNKAVSIIPSQVKTDLLNQNLVSAGYTSLSLRDMIYANPVAFLSMAVAAMLLLGLGGLFLIRNRMQNALMQSQLEAAEAKSLAKSEFLSRMSHEIRTPMNAIVGLTDLTCMEPNLSVQVEEKLQKIRSSSQYLLSLINDILDMSRIENGKMEIEQRDFSLSDILDELEGMMGTQAKQKNLAFQSLRKIGQDRLMGDPLRLRQILTNLLSNAIKFTPSGGEVTLRAEETAFDGQEATYLFAVADTGIGIPPEDQERVFAAFEQVATSTSRSVGTGLGLPISRSMARLMGGDLSVKSASNQGSVFYMTLRFPLSVEGPPPQVKKAACPVGTLQGVRVLLVEDNDLNAEIAHDLLMGQGLIVHRAANGREGVDLFTASQPGTFQLILMDIRMPVMDGHEAARAIRSSNRPDAHVPIIAMTANSFKEDEAAARAAGMNGFVPKPVDIHQLLSVMREMLTLDPPQ